MRAKGGGGLAGKHRHGGYQRLPSMMVFSDRVVVVGQRFDGVDSGDRGARGKSDRVRFF